jgi:hypothetical protein
MKTLRQFETSVKVDHFTRSKAPEDVNFMILIIYRGVNMDGGTADGGTVVKVLCYKSVGRWFDSRWCQGNFSLT